jgi:hypothetical protein
LEHQVGAPVQADAGQRRDVPVAPARVAIRLRHQLGDGAPAVAGHLGGVAPGGRDHPAVDDEQAVVVAPDVLLHQHAAPVDGQRQV